jgi:drug/metabolite transporter (DMT)-like permease
VLVSWPDATGTGPGSTWIGDLLFAGTSVLWALYTLLARRWQIDPVRGTAVVWVLALAYLPAYAALAESRLSQAPPGEVLFQAAYQGVGVALGALLLYTVTIRVLGSSIASLFMPLIPVFGVLIAIPALGENPSRLQVVGMLSVILGMVLAATRAVKPSKDGRG